MGWGSSRNVNEISSDAACRRWRDASHAFDEKLRWVFGDDILEIRSRMGSGGDSRLTVEMDLNEGLIVIMKHHQQVLCSCNHLHDSSSTWMLARNKFTDLYIWTKIQDRSELRDQTSSAKHFPINRKLKPQLHSMKFDNQSKWKAKLEHFSF